jgi:benzodiazapine receptor
MLLVVLGLGLNVLAAACLVPLLRFAFQRSVGTGVMVLCLPVYTLYFAFSQFEHRLKGLLLAGALGGFVLGVVLRAVGLALGAAALPPPALPS